MTVSTCGAVGGSTGSCSVFDPTEVGVGVGSTPATRGPRSLIPTPPLLPVSRSTCGIRPVGLVRSSSTGRTARSLAERLMVGWPIAARKAGESSPGASNHGVGALGDSSSTSHDRSAASLAPVFGRALLVFDAVAAAARGAARLAPAFAGRDVRPAGPLSGTPARSDASSAGTRRSVRARTRVAVGR